MIRTIHPGTISHGTLRVCDLYVRFRDTLRELAPEAYQQLYSPAVGFVCEPIRLAEDAYVGFWESDDASEALSVLSEALAEIAPSGLYFGAHEGDGADFGFWPYDCEDRE